MTSPTYGIEPWHVLLTVIGSVITISLSIGRVIRTFHKTIVDELKVTRISIKELLSDLAVRNPTAMARIVAAIDDKSVIEFVRSSERRRKTRD